MRGVAAATAVMTAAALAPLDARLAHSVQCSKQARRALERGRVATAWVDVTDQDAAAAEPLEDAAVGPERRAHDEGEAFDAHNAVSRSEFFEFYQGEGLDPANNELRMRARRAGSGDA